jgi:hypothetical protein
MILTPDFLAGMLVGLVAIFAIIAASVIMVNALGATK